MSEILRRRYKVRPVGSEHYRYKQITIPAECVNLKMGDFLTIIHTEDWALLVPAGTVVDEKMVERAIGGQNEKR